MGFGGLRSALVGFVWLLLTLVGVDGLWWALVGFSGFGWLWLTLVVFGCLWSALVGFGRLHGWIVNGPCLGHSRLSHLMEMHLRITSGPKRCVSDMPHMGDAPLLLYHTGELVPHYFRMCVRKRS